MATVPPIPALAVRTTFARDMQPKGWTLESDSAVREDEALSAPPECLPFLQQEERSIKGDTLLVRATDLGCPWGQRHAETLLENQHLMPVEARQYALVEDVSQMLMAYSITTSSGDASHMASTPLKHPRTTVLSCFFRPQHDPHARETPPIWRGPLTEGPKCNLQTTDALLSLLVLYKDRTLVGPLHNAFLSRFSTPRDAQLNRAFQAKETGGRTGQEG